MAWNIAPPEGQLGWRVPISVPALTPLTEMHAVAGILPAGLQLIVPIRSPLMTSVAAMLTPTVGLSLPPIVAPLLHATAAMPTPTVATGFVMVPPAMAAVAQIPAPALSVSQALTAPVLHATAAIPTPTVSVASGINIPAPMLQATAAIPTPVVSVGGAITAPLLAATAVMPAPSLLVGTGVTINVPPPTQIVADNFQRADSTTSAGPNWTDPFGNTNIGIRGNTAYPVGTTGYWAVASNNTPLSTDDADVSITVGAVGAATTDAVNFMLGCNAAGEGAQGWAYNGTSIAIYSQPSWAGTATQQVGLGYTWTAGDTLTLRRRGNVYTILKNGVSTGCTWTDSTNIIPIDANHRSTAMGIVVDPNARHITNFQASNVPTAGIVATAALLAPTVTVTAPPVGAPHVISTAIQRAATR